MGSSEISILKQLVIDTIGIDPLSITPIKGGGSSRHYYRIYLPVLWEGRTSLIGTIGSSVRENDAFEYLSAVLNSKGVNVPVVLAKSADRLVYLQTDLGDTELFSLISCSDRVSFMPLFDSVMGMLSFAQSVGQQVLDFSRCFPHESMNIDTVRWDLNYFKYCFLRQLVEDWDENLLQEEFNKLERVIAKDLDSVDTLMLRDFQSRNVMVYDGIPYLIDFQGARRGPIEYDVASFIWQARAAFSEEEKDMLLKSYIYYAKRHIIGFEDKRFLERLPYFVVLRMLQTLGAYGFRGLSQCKTHFLQSIPNALSNLQDYLNRNFPKEFSTLKALLNSASESKRVSYLKILNDLPKYDGLTVMITSFAFKEGYPVDLSGNGGGFVFDCRALHNPGRYEEYKHLTGLDESVRLFLKRNSKVLQFIDDAYDMVTDSIEKYLERGFSSLQVAFGCTGGQHRSVFCADSVGKLVASKFHDVRVVVIHREQQISEILL